MLSEHRKEAIWQAALKLQVFTLEEIVRETGAFPPATSEYLSDLVADKKLFQKGKGWERSYSLAVGNGRRASSEIKVPPTLDGLWKLIRHFKTFTQKELVKSSKMKPSQVRNYVAGLVNAKYLKAEPIARRAFRYTLVKDCGIHRPTLRRDGTTIKPSNYQRMWMAMKPLQVFDARDLSMAAGTSVRLAKFYCAHLARGGYLSVQYPNAARQAGFTEAAYRFNRTRDTGPKAPVVKPGNYLYDQNLGEFVKPNQEAA